jgi:ubiquinone biosynthesis protein Coq4
MIFFKKKLNIINIYFFFKKRDKLSQMHLMSKRMNLSKDLENRITKYMEFVWDQEEKMNPEHENMIMSKLSSSLRDEVFFQTNVKYLKMVPILGKILSEKNMLEIANKLKILRFMPEEYIYEVKYYFLYQK